jgi:phytol kinase
MPPDGADRIVAAAAVVIVAYAGLFGGAELLRRWGIAGELTRSLVHVLSAFLALGLPYLFGSAWPVVLLAIAFALSMVTSERFGLLGSIHDVRRRTVGAAVFPLGIAAAYTLTGGQAPGYPIAVLALGLGDPAAALAGRRFARGYFEVWGTRRSLEGSAVACLVSGAVTLVVLAVAGGAESASLVPTAIAVGVAVALAEATSPLGFDNVGIPVVAAIMASVIGAPWRLAAIVAILTVVTAVGLARGRSATSVVPGRIGRPS